MNWDEFMDDDADAASASEPQQFAPDGTHAAEIKWAGIQSKEWAKKESNKDGKVLTVKLEISPRYKAVWESIPCQQRGRIEQLCRSARVDPPSGNWDEQVLKGQFVSVETVLALSKAGNEFVRVAAWKPGPEPLPKSVREAPARTPAAKVKAASPSIGSDDIPF